MREFVNVNLANLFHHYYLDSFGKAPPNPDPAHFEHVQFLVPASEFRFQGEGLGDPTHVRRNRSQELGHAFCRWFLHEYLNITYFAHMGKVLNKMDGFTGCSVNRTMDGDTPDYLCANERHKIFLAEAKGRYGSVGFDTTEFKEWREQFTRVEVKNPAGAARVMKGFIVATRFATEIHPKVRTTLYGEDPETRGEGRLDENAEPTLAARVISLHYSEIALKMNQQLLSAALGQGFILPEEIIIPATMWEFIYPYPPLQRRRFVGGYYSRLGLPLPMREVGGRVVLNNFDPLRLDSGGGTFFGLEEKIFEQVSRIARRGTLAATEVDRFEFVESFFSGVSLVRDGSILAPIEFLRPVESREF